MVYRPKFCLLYRDLGCEDWCGRMGWTGPPRLLIPLITFKNPGTTRMSLLGCLRTPDPLPSSVKKGTPESDLERVDP